MSGVEQAVRAEDERHVSEIVGAAKRIVVVAGRSKQGLYASGSRPELTQLDVSRLTGIVDYLPSEFTITVGAATRLEELSAVLAKEGQFLPFDPPAFTGASTIGGTVSAGLSGPCRLRYGGVRDFCLAVRAVDGSGASVVGGCPVVKNAAGFDLPKLLVGSCGSLAVITQLTLKVLPRPATYRSIRIDCESLQRSMSLLAELGRAPIEIDAIDLQPPATLLVRVSGTDRQSHELAKRVCKLAGCPAEIIDSSTAESDGWDFSRWLPTAADENLVRVPLSPAQLAALDSRIAPLVRQRRYVAAGNVAWLWVDDAAALSQLGEVLKESRVSGQVLIGSGKSSVIGYPVANAFARRVKAALDPHNKYFDIFGMSNAA